MSARPCGREGRRSSTEGEAVTLPGCVRARVGAGVAVGVAARVGEGPALRARAGRAHEVLVAHDGPERLERDLAQQVELRGAVAKEPPQLGAQLRLGVTR
eukprot:3773827-Prymnesium_polylepis.1